MNKIAIITDDIIENLQKTQELILKKLENTNNTINEKYISRQSAANMFDCDEQTIANFEKEGLLNRYGRARFIRYSVDELKHALGINK